LDALKLQGFDGCFGCRWRFEIHEAVALALVSVLVQDGFRRDDGSESAPAIPIYRNGNAERRQKEREKKMETEMDTQSINPFDREWEKPTKHINIVYKVYILI
jgi:hypothetical protein